MHKVMVVGLPRKHFIEQLRGFAQVLVVRSGKAAASLADQHSIGVIIVDAASLRTNGLRICRLLKGCYPQLRLLHICDSAVDPASSPADVVLTTPLDIHQLHALFDEPMTHKNGNGAQLLHVGPFRLDCEQYRLMLPDRELVLTPKQGALLAAFMHHPNQTLTREWLMQHVWQTDYIGDTRTLSVHIRWLRRLLEPEESDTRYLYTVRGVGYRLQIT